MTENDANQDYSTSNLRQRAEQQLGPLTGSGQDSAQADAQRLLHELRVHQIELEVQNEDLQRVQAELEASHSRYFDIFEMAPVGYVILNQPGLILNANLTSAGLLGMERSALVKRPLSRFILPDDQDIYYLHRKQLFETGAPQVGELRMLKKDGAQIWVQMQTTVAQDADGAPVYRVTLSDITERKQAEEALRESEAQYRLVTDNCADTIWLMDMNLKTTYISPSVVRTRGFTLEELSAMPLDQHVTPASLSYIKQILAEELTPERLAQANLQISRTLELEFYRKDGSSFWSENTFTVIRDDQGTPIGILGVGRDITARKQNEQALRESEERYRSLFDRMLDGIYRSTHAGKFVDVNPAMVKMFGFSSKEEMLEVDIKNELYFAPEERRPVLDTGQEMIEIYRMRRKDGSEIWVEDHGHYVHDEQGRVIYHEGILRDITERRQLTKKMLASQ